MHDTRTVVEPSKTVATRTSWEGNVGTRGCILQLPRPPLLQTVAGVCRGFEEFIARVSRPEFPIQKVRNNLGYTESLHDTGRRREICFFLRGVASSICLSVREAHTPRSWSTGTDVRSGVPSPRNDIGTNSITIDERFCRGDWGAPKSEASNATIGVNSCVIERIHGLKKLTVQVKAGNAIRKYKVVKSDGPDDLVFQSVRSGKPLRDNKDSAV